WATPTGQPPQGWELDPVPEWVVEKCAKPAHAKVGHPEVDAEHWDHPTTIKDVAGKLRTMGKNVTCKQGSRNADAASLAGICMPYTLSEPVIVDLLRDYIAEIGGEEPEEGLDFVVASVARTAEGNGDRGHDLGFMRLVETSLAQHKPAQQDAD